MSKYLNFIFLGFVCLMVMSFFYSIAFNSIMIGALSISFLFDYKNIKSNLILYFNNRRNLILLMLFISLLLSTIYSNNWSYGLSSVFKFSTLVTLPLALIRIKEISPYQVTFLKKFYIAICFLASGFCLILALSDSGFLNGHYKQAVSSENYTTHFAYYLTYHQLSDHLSLHAIYFAVAIALAIFMLITELNPTSLFKKIIISFLLLYFTVFLCLLKATAINFALYSIILTHLYRTQNFRSWKTQTLFYGLTLLATSVVSYLFTLKYIGQYDQGLYLFNSSEINTKIAYAHIIALSFAILAVFSKVLLSRKASKIILLSVFALGILTVSTLIVKNKFAESIKTEKKEGVTNISARLGSWMASWRIIEEHPVLGVGIGDERDVLVNKYEQMGFWAGVESKFDTHNQYLQFWINSGILAFLCFTLLIITELYKAFQKKNFILQGFVFCFAILGISESFMNAQSARTYFIFFICLLEIFNNYSQRKTIPKT